MARGASGFKRPPPRGRCRVGPVQFLGSRRSRLSLACSQGTNKRSENPCSELPDGSSSPRKLVGLRAVNALLCLFNQNIFLNARICGQRLMKLAPSQDSDHSDQLYVLREQSAEPWCSQA